MAKIYPQWIPESEREARPRQRAEHIVYHCLDEQLGDEWLVLYGQAIKRAHSRRGVSDREADFIVAHPKLGVVMIEVKGGSIERKGGYWYSIPLSQPDRPRSRQLRFRIKNPYQQATKAAYIYERKLDEYIANQNAPRSLRFPKRSFKIATAVCFPDVDIPPDFHLTGDALPELTLSHRDLPNLKDRLYQIFKLYQGKTDEPPGEKGIELLKIVLARDWHIKTFLAYEFDTVEQRRKQLTEEQFHLLYSLGDNPKMLIAGCAGSGKTVLAVEKARRLADQGRNVLFTCFNAQLAEWLKIRPYIRENIKVAHFHDLCRWAASLTEKADLPEGSEDLGISKSTYFKETMPEALMIAAEDLGLTFDAIIVDEGQDFEESWFHVLDGLLKDSDESIFYIFYDDNQRVFGKRKNIPSQWPVYRLTKNMRNTNPIFNLILKYYHDPESMSTSGISGPDPMFVPLNDYADEYEAVQSVLARLVEQRIRPSQVAILTPCPRDKSLWSNLDRRSGQFTPVWRLKTRGNQVTCSTIRTFKGLERPVIILTELHRLEPREVEQLMYVAISRARNYLVVIGELPAVKREA